jgi:hypothetical protein
MIVAELCNKRVDVFPSSRGGEYAFLTVLCAGLPISLTTLRFR